MTVEQMLKSNKVTLSPADVSEAIACDPRYIRAAAKTNPESLGFPVMLIGNSTRIPRIPFLRFLGYEVKE